MWFPSLMTSGMNLNLNFVLKWVQTSRLSLGRIGASEKLKVFLTRRCYAPESGLIWEMSEFTVSTSAFPKSFRCLFLENFPFPRLLYSSDGTLEYSFQILSRFLEDWVFEACGNAFFNAETDNPACVGFIACHDLLLKDLGISRVFSAKQIFPYFFWTNEFYLNVLEFICFSLICD